MKLRNQGIIWFALGVIFSAPGFYISSISDTIGSYPFIASIDGFFIGLSLLAGVFLTLAIHDMFEAANAEKKLKQKRGCAE